MRLLLALILLSLALPQTSAASDKRPMFTSKAQILDSFADCVAKNYPKSAERFLQTVEGSKDEREKGLLVFESSNKCVGDRYFLSMDVRSIRGSLSRSFILADQNLLYKIRTKMALEPVRLQMVAAEEFGPAFANCLVKSNPSAVLAILSEKAESDAERERFLDAGETLKGCMPVPATYTLNIRQMRAELSIALYRESVAN